MTATPIPPSTDAAFRSLAHGNTTAGVLIWNDVTDEGRSAFYQWHNGEHMPERLSIPGFLRGRRYASEGQSPQWFTLYEAASLDVLVSPGYLERLNNPTPGTQATLKFFRNTARSVCVLQRAVGQAVGGYAVVLRFDGRSESAELATAKAQAIEALEQLEAQEGVVSTSLYGADVSASRIDTAESRTRTFDIPQLTLVIEASHRSAACQAMEHIQRIDWNRVGLSLRKEHGLYALEVCFA